MIMIIFKFLHINYSAFAFKNFWLFYISDKKSNQDLFSLCNIFTKYMVHLYNFIILLFNVFDISWKECIF